MENWSFKIFPLKSTPIYVTNKKIPRILCQKRLWRQGIYCTQRKVRRVMLFASEQHTPYLVKCNFAFSRLHLCSKFISPDDYVSQICQSAGGTLRKRRQRHREIQHELSLVSEHLDKPTNYKAKWYIYCIAYTKLY